VRFLLADRAGKVVGAARLAVAQEPNRDGLAPVAREIGWPRAIRAAFALGLLVHQRLEDDEAYLEQFAVHADQRRRGIGRRLLEACEAEALDAGKRRMTLWVTEGNAAAVNLYRTSGYRVTRRWRTLRGRILFGAPVALLMEKRIRSP
jgi:ribosomal protein S18 acetylase RimI-like enzyme